jgi:hypothetical protein
MSTKISRLLSRGLQIHDESVKVGSEAIQPGNKSALMYDTRGRAYLYAGALTKALADFDKASELTHLIQVMAGIRWRMSRKSVDCVY